MAIPVSEAMEDEEGNASNKVNKGNNQIAGVADAVETNNIRDSKAY